jgi:DNA polymerase III epsilon subunit-like protein
MKNKADARYLFIDTETGGVIPGKHSLLSIGLVIWERDTILDRSEFFVRNSEYVLTQKAISMTKFNRDLHELKAENPNEVINSMLRFVYQYFDKNELIPIIGHNVQFDVNFLKIFFSENNRSFNQYFSHRVIDTYSIFKFLYLTKIIDENLTSSSDAFRYFDISVKERHSALEDCIATVKLFEKLIDLVEKQTSKS